MRLTGFRSGAQAGADGSLPGLRQIVSKYPVWTATVVWKDGHADHFDGAKDMFKFLQALPKYAPSHKRADIRFLAVTDFYNLEKIEAGKAFYVIGSDVMGPMGPELVPLATRADAEDFLKDHKASSFWATAKSRRRSSPRSTPGSSSSICVNDND